MLSIHWLYRKSCNCVVKTLGIDVIVTSHMMSTFNIVDINVKEYSSFMVTPTLTSNAGDRKVCKKKNPSWLFCAERKIRPSGSLFGITRLCQVIPISDPGTDFSIRTSHPWKILIFCYTLLISAFPIQWTDNNSLFESQLFRSWYCKKCTKLKENSLGLSIMSKFDCSHGQ